MKQPRQKPPAGRALRGLSQRKLAVALGVSPKAIRTAVAKKWIVPLADGSFDEAAARAAYVSRADPARTKVRRENPVPSVATPADAKAAVSLVRQILMDEGMPAGGAMDFDQARTADVILKTRERALRMEVESGKLVDADVVRDEVFKLSRADRDAWVNWPSRVAPLLAAEFGLPLVALALALEREVRAHLFERADPKLRT